MKMVWILLSLDLSSCLFGSPLALLSTSKAFMGKFLFIKALGFLALPLTNKSNLCVPVALEHGINVILPLFNLRPGALVSLEGTNVLLGHRFGQE